MTGDASRESPISVHSSNTNHILDRTDIEEILGELAANGYLQRHGFKNQYGADERLHQLVDYRMIYGNFSAGSDSVTVHYKSKLLGEVPAINLLRVGSGTVVRFAGKNWVVQRASRDGITVLPASSARGAVDFVYPGKGPPTDAFLPNRMWQLLHESELPTDTLSRDLVDHVSALRELSSRSLHAAPDPVFSAGWGYPLLHVCRLFGEQGDWTEYRQGLQG